MTKDTKKNEKVFTSEQRTAVCKYLAQRLAFYGVKYYNFVELKPNKYYSCPLPKEALGVFGLALKSCDLVFRVWESQHNEGLNVGCDLQYEHLGGGSNGCVLAVKLHVNSDAVVVEDYS